MLEEAALVAEDVAACHCEVALATDAFGDGDTGLASFGVGADMNFAFCSAAWGPGSRPTGTIRPTPRGTRGLTKRRLVGSGLGGHMATGFALGVWVVG